MDLVWIYIASTRGFKSQAGDAGADSEVFTESKEFVANPNPPCGMRAKMGALDFDSSFSQAEAMGVGNTLEDGSFEALIFQVNRDGGGQCTCEYNTVGQPDKFKFCKTLINPPGQNGIWPQDRVNHTAKFQLPRDTTCRGGMFKDKCLIRIRCGEFLRFGGCLAIKTPASPHKLQLKVVIGGKTSMKTKPDLPRNDVSSIAQKVFNTLKAKGAFVPISSGRYKRSPAMHIHALQHVRTLGVTPLKSNFDSMADEISFKVIELMRANKVFLVAKKAKSILKDYRDSTSAER
uniref:Secreted protein n=1 Tax=Phakopsora pachyrhizi TaxID=170000 RepID=A0A0S1MK98_PHAPC